MKNYLSNLTPEKSIYLSKVIGGLTLCVAAIATILESHHYLIVVVLLMAAISAYLRFSVSDKMQ